MKLTAGIFLAFLSLIIFAMRLHTFREPLERDITTYAVIAHEMLEGRKLYSDLWDHKPPAIHVTYALGEWIAGYGPRSIYFLTVGASILTLIGIFLLGALKGRMAAYWAGIFWALFSGDLVLEANQPNTEIFINAFLTLGLYFWFRTEREGEKNFRNPLLAGALVSVATLYKHIVVIPFFVLIVLQLLFPSSESGRKRVLRNAFLAALPIVFSWASLFLYFSATGRRVDFVDAVFTFNFQNVGLNVFSFPTFLHLLKLTFFQNRFLVQGLFIVLTVGFTVGFYRKEFRSWLVLAGYSLGLFLCVVLMRYRWPHHFQLLMPPLVVAASWLIGEISVLAYRNLLGMVFVAALLWRELPFYQLSAEEWSLRKYGDVFSQCRKMGNTLNSLVPADSTFYMWGFESGLYYYSRRSPPTGIVYNYPLLRSTLSEALSQRVLEDLKKRRPSYVVLTEPFVSRTPPGLRRWVEENYAVMEIEKGFSPRFVVMKAGR